MTKAILSEIGGINGTEARTSLGKKNINFKKKKWCYLFIIDHSFCVSAAPFLQDLADVLVVL